MTEDSFSIMREHFSNQEDPTLLHADAARFVSQLHFVGTSSGYDTNHCIHYILAMNVDAELEEPQLLLRHLLLHH
jgi:hypothetical protein